MSVHLALGTISPRQVHAAVVGAGEVPGSPGWWVASHLEIRDFFAYVALALGTKLFAPSPALAVAHEKRKSSGKHGGEQGALWRSAATDGANAYRRWATGNTGLPLVDAAMRELVTTGYCSSRARQNAASVLTKDLCVDWRAGAALFQFLLADHDVGSNFGNWAYFSGVGFDPKNRHYRSISQAIKYDPCGAYVRRWLPALREASDAEALWPFDGAVPGWPEPIVAPRTQLSYPDAVERFGE
jgi:deoxyribodipyrimidine photo-lyase